MTTEIVFGHGGTFFAYYLGIAKYMKETLDLSDVVYSGTSAGNLPCILLCAEKNIDKVFRTILGYIAGYAKTKTWEEIIRMTLNDIIREDDIPKLNDKYHCKMTKIGRFYFPGKAYTKTWKNKEDLVDCVTAACFVPGLCGNKLSLPYRGESVLDGFFTGTSEANVTESERTLLIKANKWRNTLISSYLPNDDLAYLSSLYTLGYCDAKKNKEEFDFLLKEEEEILYEEQQ
jgi:hypothetical protein